MDIDGNYTRNVWTSTCRNYRKQFTCATLRQTQVLTNQTCASLMETSAETHLTRIGSRQFWNWLCRIRARISSNECIENVL